MVLLFDHHEVLLLSISVVVPFDFGTRRNLVVSLAACYHNDP